MWASLGYAIFLFGAVVWPFISAPPTVRKAELDGTAGNIRHTPRASRHILRTTAVVGDREECSGVDEATTTRQRGRQSST